MQLHEGGANMTFRPAKHHIRRFARMVRRKLHRLHREQITSVLANLRTSAPRLLFVHSSLSRCGHIVGGPSTVVSALEQWSAGGTLLMPTHSYCYPDDAGKREVFDPQTTKSRVGAISDYFWRQPGVTRSLHPTHSLAAFGPASEELCAHHEIADTPCGPGTPYERLIERDAAVMMFGATMNTYTLFHTTESAANVPYLYEQKPLEVYAKGANNSITMVRMRRQDMQVARRFEAMAGWLADRKALIRHQLGMGELLYIPSSARVHQLISTELQRDPYFLVAR
jgi:aminoglycoside 3-N-acetyltransferase